jgi:hypothetical protein
MWQHSRRCRQAVEHFSAEGKKAAAVKNERQTQPLLKLLETNFSFFL